MLDEDDIDEDFKGDFKLGGIPVSWDAIKYSLENWPEIGPDK